MRGLDVIMTIIVGAYIGLVAYLAVATLQ